jgi:hypothetical protein
MSTYINHGKTTSAKRNSGWKSTLTERDRHALRKIVSKNHTTAAAQVNCSRTEYSSWRPGFHKNLSDVSFSNPMSTVAVWLQLLNLWLLKVMLRCVNDGVTTIKPGQQNTGILRVIWSDVSSFTLFPTSGRVYVWRAPKEAYNLECLVRFQQWNIGNVVWWFGSSIMV